MNSNAPVGPTKALVTELSGRTGTLTSPVSAVSELKFSRSSQTPSRRGAGGHAAVGRVGGGGRGAHRLVAERADQTRHGFEVLPEPKEISPSEVTKICSFERRLVLVTAGLNHSPSISRFPTLPRMARVRAQHNGWRSQSGGRCRGRRCRRTDSPRPGFARSCSGPCRRRGRRCPGTRRG